MEGDILEAPLWSHAFEFLKKTGAVFLSARGPGSRAAGSCWIDGNRDPRPTSRRLRRRPARILVLTQARPRSIVEGSATEPGGIEPAREGDRPIGRDGDASRERHTAYQLWKFGLLGKDSHYRVSRQNRREPPLVDRAPTRANADSNHPGVRRAPPGCATSSTRGSRMLQKLVKQALAALRHERQASHSVHYPTRWSLSPTRPRASSDTTPVSTPIGRSSSVRTEGVLASRRDDLLRTG